MEVLELVEVAEVALDGICLPGSWAVDGFWVL